MNAKKRTKTKPLTYEQLLAIKSIKKFTQSKQLDVIGNLFDFSFDKRNLDGIAHAFALSEQIDYDALKPANKILYHYDISNGWSYIRKLKYQQSELWNFQLAEITHTVFHLRKAISIDGFEKINPLRKCQIYTNLGNDLSFVGRFIEAQEAWTKALKVNSNFIMAYGNMGNGLFFYGQYLFDPNHQEIFKIFGYHYLKVLIDNKQSVHIGAWNFFLPMYEHHKNNMQKRFMEKLPDMNTFKLGRQKDLRKYRRWALDNILYINPLNDLGPDTIASHDILNLSKIAFKTKSPPNYFTLYNQIKQEYATARFMYYESIQGYKPHFSDVDTVILETNETARYSYYVEQLKASYRIAYSIFDKIAFLLNDYLKIGIPQHEVSFRTLWFEKPKKGSPMTLRPVFLKSKNLALKGLFWLSKDLFEKGQDFDTVLEPDARELARIRNFIEHKAFKVVSDFFPYPPYFEQSEDLSYVISRQHLEQKSLKLLKMVRAAIIYASLAINKEESQKDNSELKAMTIPLQELSHKNKV